MHNRPSEQLTAICESFEKYRSTGLVLDRTATNQILDLLADIAFEVFHTEDELVTTITAHAATQTSKRLLEATLTRVRGRLAEYELYAQPPATGQPMRGSGNVVPLNHLRSLSMQMMTPGDPA